jgi:hypothetical protein
MRRLCMYVCILGNTNQPNHPAISLPIGFPALFPHSRNSPEFHEPISLAAVCVIFEFTVYIQAKSNLF